MRVSRFPLAVAGDGDRAAVAFLGSTDDGNPGNRKDFTGVWRIGGDQLEVTLGAVAADHPQLCRAVVPVHVEQALVLPLLEIDRRELGVARLVDEHLFLHDGRIQRHVDEDGGRDEEVVAVVLAAVADVSAGEEMRQPVEVTPRGLHAPAVRGPAPPGTLRGLFLWARSVEFVDWIFDSYYIAASVCESAFRR